MKTDFSSPVAKAEFSKFAGIFLTVRVLPRVEDPRLHLEAPRYREAVALLNKHSAGSSLSVTPKFNTQLSRLHGGLLLAPRGPPPARGRG